MSTVRQFEITMSHIADNISWHNLDIDSASCGQLTTDSSEPISLTFAPSYAIFLLACVCSIVILAKRKTVKQANNLPPGPRGLPIIGSLLDLRTARSDPSKFAQWALSLTSYGEMTTLRMGSRTWVMLNSQRAAKGIITKHATTTGDRPDFPVSGTLVSKDKRTVLRKTKDWHEGRKLMHHLLNGTSVATYANIQEEESLKLLHNYLCDPRDWNKHHYDYAYSIVHRIVLGERTKHTTRQLKDFQRVTAEFLQSISSSVFEFFPRSVLFQPFLKSWERMGSDHYAVFKDWWDPVAQDIVDGLAAPSFARDTMKQSKTKYATDNDEAMYLATSIVAAGSDNVRRAQNVFMMAAICHPHIVAKARAMVDAVCGSDAQRLPNVADMDSLLYISAILKECLRWRPVVPLIPQHQSTSTVHFDGYTFPAGTDFVINSLAVSMEDEEPTHFKPERWTGKEENLIDGLWQFGGGRRICVGYKIAHQELFLAISRLIYCFDFEPAGPVNSTHLRHDAVEEPFPVKISIRSPAHAELITALHDRLV